jgi:hypothetical protein
VQATVDAIAKQAGANAILFDASRRIVAATFHPLRIDLSGDGTLMFDTLIRGGRVRQAIDRPQAVIRDRDGNVAGYLFIVPRPENNLPTTRSLDRSFFWTFSGAALFGVVMAVLIARWVTVPIERLTAATRQSIPPADRSCPSWRADSTPWPPRSIATRSCAAAWSPTSRTSCARR